MNARHRTLTRCRVLACQPTPRINTLSWNHNPNERQHTMSRTHAHVHRSKLDQSLPWPLFRKQFSRTDTDYRDEWFGPLANKRPRKSRAAVSQTLHRLQAGLIDPDDMVF